MSQLLHLKFQPNTNRFEHGGSFKNPQKCKRPISLRSHNHLVLRSSKAINEWSFRRNTNHIEQILKRFAKIHHIGLVSFANVGNHIHLDLHISTRKQYQKFIRAITSSIMMAVTGYSRWKKAPKNFQFWDARPYSRIISSWREIINLKTYVRKNQWEGRGVPLEFARYLARQGWSPPDS